jgi:hypothetical protein
MYKASIQSMRLMSFKRRWYNANQRFSLIVQVCPSMEIIFLTSGDSQVYGRASYSDSFNVSEFSSLAFRMVLMMLQSMASCFWGWKNHQMYLIFIKVQWFVAVFKCIHDLDQFMND